MLPHVDPEQGHEAGGGLQGVLVGARRDLEAAGGLVVAQPAPAGALEEDDSYDLFQPRRT